MPNTTKASTSKPILPPLEERCSDEDHDWGGEQLTLDGRGVLSSIDGRWRCNGQRRRCRSCGLVQDAEMGDEDWGDWHDTAYSEDVVRAPAYDPRRPSGYEKQLIQQGYGPTAAFALAQDLSLVEGGHVRLVTE